MDVEHFYFPSGDHQLYGALHKPLGKVRGAVVLCAPFAEEQKTTYHTYARFAAAVAREGWFALQFDYRGTGDSSGSFVEFSPSGAREDIHTAIQYVRERTGVHHTGLFGLRLGASLAFEVMESEEDVVWLAMWQPVINGEEFFKQNIKRQMVRQMLIRAAGDSQDDPQKERPAGEADFIDLDGYPLSRVACDELRGLMLSRLTLKCDGPTLLVQVSTGKKPEAAMQQLATACGLGDNFRTYRSEPFWNRIGHIDVGPLIDLTMEWLRNQRAL